MQVDPARAMKELRAKKLAELGKSVQTLAAKETMDTVKEFRAMEKVEEGIADENDNESDAGYAEFEKNLKSNDKSNVGPSMKAEERIHDNESDLGLDLSGRC